MPRLETSTPFASRRHAADESWDMSRTRRLALLSTPWRGAIVSAIVALGGTLALSRGHLFLFTQPWTWVIAGIVFVLAGSLLVGPASWLHDHADAKRPLLGALGRVL